MEQVWKDITLAPADLNLTTAVASKKRFPDCDTTSADDRHHKRMIKNRESAARSRARKQESGKPLSLSWILYSYYFKKNIIFVKFKSNIARNYVQTYTNELELEVAHLLQENAMLRKQHLQVCVWDVCVWIPIMFQVQLWRLQALRVMFHALLC